MSSLVPSLRKCEEKYWPQNLAQMRDLRKNLTNASWISIAWVTQEPRHRNPATLPWQILARTQEQLPSSGLKFLVRWRYTDTPQKAAKISGRPQQKPPFKARTVQTIPTSSEKTHVFEIKQEMNRMLNLFAITQHWGSIPCSVPSLAR